MFPELVLNGDFRTDRRNAIKLLDLFVQHADTAFRGLIADAFGLDRSMNPIARLVESHPPRPEGVLRTSRRENGPGFEPGRVNQFIRDLELAYRSAILFTGRHGIFFHGFIIRVKNQRIPGLIDQD